MEISEILLDTVINLDVTFTNLMMKFRLQNVFLRWCYCNYDSSVLLNIIDHWLRNIPAINFLDFDSLTDSRGLFHFERKALFKNLTLTDLRALGGVNLKRKWLSFAEMNTNNGGNEFLFRNRLLFAKVFLAKKCQEIGRYFQEKTSNLWSIPW